MSRGFEDYEVTKNLCGAIAVGPDWLGSQALDWVQLSWRVRFNLSPYTTRKKQERGNLFDEAEGEGKGEVGRRGKR